MSSGSWAIHETGAWTRNNPTVITKNGQTAVVLIVPEDDADLERLLLSRSQTLQDVLRERREEIRRGETITLEEAFA
jgi:PHD/YefM family antitoxin component YafN of YafNO toxin-antitoxin module